MSGGPPLGPELVLPGDTTPALSVGTQTNPSLAEGPDGVTLAVWQDTRSGGNPNVYQGVGIGTMTDIYAARVRADGSVIDVTPIPVAVNSYNQDTPKAAWNGTNWLVAWHTERDADRYETDINAVRIAPDGTVLDQQPIVVGAHLPHPTMSNDLDPVGPLQVVSNGRDWFVEYRRHNVNLAGGIGMEWFATKVTADGQVPNLEGVKLLSATQNDADFGLAFSPVNGGQFMHAYRAGGASYTRRYDADMTYVAGSQTVAPAGAGGPKMNIAGGPSGWLLAWEGSFGAWPQILAARVGADGAALDATAIEITEPTYGIDFSLDATWNGADWTVAYNNGGEGGDDLYARRIDPTGPAAAALKAQRTIVSGPDVQRTPQLVTSGDGGYKMLYTNNESTKPGIAVAVLSDTDQLVAHADASLAAPSQGSAELASDGSNFLMVFSSSTAYGTRVLGQRVTPEGVALEQQPFVIADVAEKATSYEVVYLNGKYVVVYSAANGPQGNQIYARTVTTGGALGAATALVPVAPGTGFGLSEASVNGDRLIVLGNSNEGTLHQSRRFFRVFDHDLAPVSARVQIGTNYALSGDTEPVQGGWVSAWATKGSHDKSQAGVAYAVIGLDGNVITPQSGIVGTWPDTSSGTPTVVSNGDSAATEAMVMYWQRRDAVRPQMTNSDGIRAQRIAATGAKLGGEITLIDEPGLQTQPSAAFDGTNYVMSWTDQRNYPYPAQARDDIYAARVAVDGTVIDAGGFPVADSFRPEMHGDVAVAGGEVMFAYRTFRHEAPWGSYRLAARGMDAAPASAPTTIEVPGFAFERDQAVEFVFDKPIMGADSADLVVRNTTTNQTIDPAKFTVQTIAANATGWTYRWKYTGGILPDGRYTATLAAGSVTDFAGRPTATDLVVNFTFLNGDANRDGRVNLNDFNVLAANFGGTGKTLSQGDFTYDGRVNLDDFNVLAGKFGQSL
jgi:hypothetical protein